MNRKISLGMAVTIVILAMTVTFSITMLIAMRLFDSTVNSVKEKESMYNKIAEVDRYVRSNDYYTIPLPEPDSRCAACACVFVRS